MKNKIIAAAYDLKASLDLASAFIKTGLSTEVFSWDGQVVESKATAIIYNLESFFFTPEKEYNVVRCVFQLAKDYDVCFFKTDSSLRGNVGAELRGLLDGLSYHPLIFVPALPSAGKFTDKNIQIQVSAGKRNIIADAGALVSEFMDTTVSEGDVTQNDTAVIIKNCMSEIDFDDICSELHRLQPKAIAGTSALASRLATIYGFPPDTSQKQADDIFLLSVDKVPGVLNRNSLEWQAL